MKNKFLLYGIFILPFLSWGCLRTYYPTIYESSQTPMIFETDTADELSSYLNADVTIANGSYESEIIRLLRGSFIIANTQNYTNFNARLFGYAGTYRVSGLENYDGEKNMFGLGGDIGLNINFKIKSFKMGLGFNIGVTGEFGDYYNFRKKADKEGIIDSETKMIFFTFSVFPVLAFNLSENTVISAQLNTGIPGFISPGIVLNNDGYIYWISWIPDEDSHHSEHGWSIGFMLDVNKFNLGL